MNYKEMPKLRIGDLEIDKPIIQGGMGVGISLSNLASAVANEGGVGIISSVGLGMLNSDPKMKFREANKIYLREEIRKAKQMTNGVIGVNIMVALSDYDAMVECAIEEEVDILFIGAGLPLRFSKNLPPERLREVKTYFIPIVSSARAARIIFEYWKKNFNHIPDGVVVEGPLAGGHLGFKKEQINNPDYTLEKILPEVISVIRSFEQQFNKNIPVIAAGGIFTGADIYKFIQLGADGVQMGTRFVATHECDASLEFKQAYVKCKKEDICIIDSPVGLPGRAIRNTFINEIESGWKCLKTCDFRKTPYCIARALTNAQMGKIEEGFTFTGSNAYRIDKIISVKELMDTLVQEYAKSELEVLNLVTEPSF